MKRFFYQDKYNNNKTWEVVKLSGGYYLRQYINGKQFGRGIRTTKKYIQEIGIFEFKKIIKPDTFQSQTVGGKDMNSLEIKEKMNEMAANSAALMKYGHDAINAIIDVIMAQYMTKTDYYEENAFQSFRGFLENGVLAF